MKKGRTSELEREQALLVGRRNRWKRNSAARTGDDSGREKAHPRLHVFVAKANFVCA
jgi:hypothetical protein